MLQAAKELARREAMDLIEDESPPPVVGQKALRALQEPVLPRFTLSDVVTCGLMEG